MGNAYYKDGISSLYMGDCVDVMSRIPDSSVDLTVTSFPYDNLRDYEGLLKWDYSKFTKVADCLLRVTKDGGAVVWVVNDATIDGSESGTSFKQALYFKSIGFNIHDTMIWVKDGGGAIGSNKCYTQNFEYMFVFSKGCPKTVNLIRDKPNASFGKDKSGVGRRKRNGELKIEKRKPSSEYSRRNNWWYIPPEKGGKHPAVFPLDLARDQIRTWSNPGDIVLDPFCGSGTTGIAANEIGRKCVLIEMVEDYCKITRYRLLSDMCLFR